MKINRQLVLEKFGSKCAYCGCNIDLKSMQVDHVISKRNFVWTLKNWRVVKIPSFLTHLTENDVNHFDNLFPSCRFCNKFKDVYSLEDFRKELFNQIERVNIYSANYRMAKRYQLVKEIPKEIVFYFENYETK